MATRNRVRSARILSETVVEFNRAVGQWKELFLTGLAIVPELEATSGDVDVVVDLEVRGPLCLKMGDIVQDMFLVHSNMRYIRDQLESVAKLNTYSPPPFKTWKYVQFLDVMTKMVKMFHDEIIIRLLSGQACTYATGEVFNAYVYGWAHLIYVNASSCDMECQAMLNEIGLSTKSTSYNKISLDL